MPKVTGVEIKLKFCTFHPTIITGTGWMGKKYAHTTNIMQCCDSGLTNLTSALIFQQIIIPSFSNITDDFRKHRW